VFHLLPGAIGVDAISSHRIEIGIDTGLNIRPGDSMATPMIHIGVFGYWCCRVAGILGAAGSGLAGIVTGEQEKEGR
jgi:hypothetical protein